jgi:hypothetical protein
VPNSAPSFRSNYRCRVGLVRVANSCMGVDPSRGTVSYVSPLARAVLTYGPGDTVEIAGGKAVILDLR